MNIYPVRRLHTWLLGSALALCLALCAACEGTDLPAATLPAPISSPTGLVTTPAPLPTRTYSPEALTAIAVKEANLQAERDYEATVAAISPAPMHTGAPTYPPHPTEVRPFGIGTFEGCGGGEGNHDPLQMRNCWHGFLGGEYSAVIAGYAAATPEPGQEARGGLYILTSINDTTEYTSSPIYWTPTRAGVVQIIAVDGTRFTLRTYKGTLFVFDAATRQWVNPAPSPSTEVPTYDPLAYHATVVAIVATLPTASPIPGLPPDKTQDRQTNDLWDRAERTAVAMNPPPNPYPTEQVATPDALTTPEGETPHQVAGAGIIWQEKWSPHFSKLMYTLNQWVERENQQGNSVLVCAGSKSPREDPQQGIIGILVQVPNSGTIVSGPNLYLTPLRAGAVQVIDAVGERLTLRADDGTLFYFDVLTRQWVTPTPGPTPIPSLPPTP